MILKWKASFPSSEKTAECLNFPIIELHYVHTIHNKKIPLFNRVAFLFPKDTRLDKGAAEYWKNI